MGKNKKRPKPKYTPIDQLTENVVTEKLEELSIAPEASNKEEFPSMATVPPPLPSPVSSTSFSVDKETPSLQLGINTPSLSQEKETPSPQSEINTPSLSSENETPALASGSEFPSIPTGKDIPSLSPEIEFPSIPTGKDTPSLSPEIEFPSIPSGKKTPNPNSGKDSPSTLPSKIAQSLASEKHKQSLDSEKDKQTPDFVKRSPSIDSGKETPSLESGKETPSLDSGKETPSLDSGMGTPSLLSGKLTPVEGISSSLSNSSKASTPSREIITAFGSSSESRKHQTELAIPKRGGAKNVGIGGRKAMVHVNHFPMKINPKIRINHYDVEVKTPFKRENRKSDEILFRQGFLQLAIVHKSVIPKNCAYDGLKNIYTTKTLKYEGSSWSGEVKVLENDFSDNEITLTYTLKIVRSKIDIAGAIDAFQKGFTANAYSEVQVLNIILSQMARTKCISLGRNYFHEGSMEGRTVDLPGGKSVWFGFFQAVNIGWKPMINVDVANKPAVKGGNLIDYMAAVLEKPGRGRDFPPERINFRLNEGKNWNKMHAATLDKDLKGLKVRYNRPDGQKREWRCNKVMDASAVLKFEHEGKIMTVANYFQLAYKYKLKFPYLPCLHLGSPQKTFFLPVELCEIKTQPLPQSKKLGEEETAKMIRETAVGPQERKLRIENSLKEISNTFKNDEYAAEFGLSVESVMSKIQARIYDPPTLSYKDLNKDKPFPFNIQQPGGKWDMLRGAPKGVRPSFIDNKHLTNWAILCIARAQGKDIEGFVNALFQEGNKIGYNIEFPKTTVYANGNNMNEVYYEFTKLCDMKVDMILIITSGKNAGIYNGLKYEGDVIRKVSTQFVQQKNIGNDRFPSKPATLHNILLKVNSKLGGTNQILDTQNTPNILKRPVMIMGADVTHPASDFKGTKPSIAAVVASMDPKASQYKCEILLQSTLQNEEVISRMEEVTTKLLREFLRRNKRKPERIIFFRDGVSEGQFLIVLNQELAALRRACSTLEENYKPAITFITAQKRHKTRLFPVDSRDGVGKNKNVPPGTAVDHTITHPTEFSFFLASHEGIQGTTKPTSYHLLWDDANMKSDDVIKMTYYLCHVYARCERSVSYPAPTYYAHLAAFRARVHHDALLANNNDSNDNRKKLEENMNLSNYFM